MATPLSKLAIVPALFLYLVSRLALADGNDLNFAEVDPLVSHMVATPIDLDALLLRGEAAERLHQPIPSIVHQIWFGDPARFEYDLTQQWQTFARQFGYQYHLWTEDDDEVLKELMGQELFARMDLCRQEHRYDAASDLVRYVLVEHFGGVYFDVDVPPPHRDGRLVDLKEIIDLSGAVFTTEWQPRDVGNSGFYVQNNVIMASPHHPIMQQLVQSLVPNWDKWMHEVGNWDLGASHITGQVLVNSTIAGSFNILTYTHMLDFGMGCYYPDSHIADLRARYEEIFGAGNNHALTSVHKGALL